MTFKGRRPILLALAVILITGAARIPLEARIEQDLIDNRFRDGTPGLELREQLGQMGFVAAFGGFRSLVASVLDMLAFVSYSNQEWGEVDSRYALICRLQPRLIKYWDLASWHMAYNAVAYYTHRNPATEHLRQAVKDRLVAGYVERGKEYLEQGLTFVPEAGELHTRLAEIYRKLDPNPPKAAEHYLQAYQHSGSEHLERAYAYELVKCSERSRWEKAYEVLCRHLKDASNPLSLTRDLKNLEERLQIPFMLRVSENR